MNSNSFYDRPDVYDITYNENFEKVLEEHYRRVFKNKNIQSILDCSFGTGNLTFVLNKIGFDLAGSDISDKMLTKAQEKANELCIDINLFQCDFRELSKNHRKKYDCVLSTGNSLGHVNNKDVQVTLREMDKLVSNKGYIYIDSRNWELILKRKQRFYYYNPFYKNDYRVNLMQVWDYNSDNTLTFNILYSYEKEDCIVKREEYKEIYYPFSKELIINELKKLGYGNIEIYNFLNPKIQDFECMEWYSIIACQE